MELKRTETGFNLDSILKELGSFGKYQILMLLLLSFRDGLLYMCNFNYVFTARDVNYRCHIPRCDNITADFRANWLEYASPDGALGKCHRYADNCNFSAYSNYNGPSCIAESFDRNRLVQCDSWVYEDNSTIVAEFDLACDDWKGPLVGTIHNIGIVVSLIISGLISDKYGRKVIICGTPIMVAICGLIKSFSTTYIMYVVLEFLESALGYGNASFIWSLESVTHDKRVVFSGLLDMITTLIGVSFSLIAYYIPYWRNLLRVIYAPLLIVVFYIFIIDEGVRWLLSKGKKEEALRIIHKVAKTNNVKLSSEALNMIKHIENEKVEQGSSNNREELLKSFKSTTIWLRLAACAFLSFSTNFVYYGLIINSVSLSGNKFLNFALVNLVSVPVRIVAALSINRFGRRTPMMTTFFLCAIFCFSSHFIPEDMPTVSSVLYLLSKMSISFGVYTLFVFTLELFPTVTRNTLGNICFMVGRIGSVLAPQTPLLSIYLKSLPLILFGCAALSACLLIIVMPDTSNVTLPDNLNDAENIKASHSNLSLRRPTLTGSVIGITRTANV